MYLRLRVGRSDMPTEKSQHETVAGNQNAGEEYYCERWPYVRIRTVQPERVKALAKLARQLNAEGWKSGRAFYCIDGKFNCARVRARRLQIGMCQRGWKTLIGCTVFEDFRGQRIGQYDPEFI
jgi:hypothetical protein